jgi:hypothetical protein
MHFIVQHLNAATERPSCGETLKRLFSQGADRRQAIPRNAESTPRGMPDWPQRPVLHN